MRRVWLMVCALSLLPGASLAGDAPDREDAKQQLSYSVGYQVGSDFRRLGLPLDPELLVRGVADAFAGSEPLMTPDEMRQTLIELQRRAAAAEADLRDAQDSDAPDSGAPDSGAPDSDAPDSDAKDVDARGGEARDS